MHQERSSVIAIVACLWPAHVSLIILSACAKAGNYTAANVSAEPDLHMYIVQSYQ